MGIGRLACLVMVMLNPAAAAADTPRPLLDVIRPANAGARALLVHAVSRSETVRQVLSELARTDVIVHLVRPMAKDPERGATRFVTATRTARYLRVTISGLLNPWDEVAVLGHELWHVLEIARAPEVRDGAGVRMLYRKGGASELRRDEFETVDAQLTQRRVAAELREGRYTSVDPALGLDFPVTNGVTSGAPADYRGGVRPRLR